MQARSRFLDLRALAALERMRFTTRNRVEGSYSGRHLSRMQGGAGEFVDFREYSGSEDLRRLDWKVYARTGKAFIRLHQDETNLLCTLAIDASGSMSFGRRAELGSKLHYVQFLATALSHVIAQAQDQVGIAILDSMLREHLPPGATLNHVARVQELIERVAVTPTTKMASALRNLFDRSSRRGVLIFMSDFLMDDVEEVFGVLRAFRHRGWEAVVLHFVDPDEERLPDGAAYRFEDLEGDGQINCSPGEIRGAYELRFKAHLAMVRKLAMAAGCDYRLVSTAIPYLRTLQGFLVERNG